MYAVILLLSVLPESWTTAPALPLELCTSPALTEMSEMTAYGPNGEHQRSVMLLQAPSLPQEVSPEVDSHCFRDIFAGRCSQSKGDDNHHTLPGWEDSCTVLEHYGTEHTQDHMEKITHKEEFIHQPCQKWRWLKGTAAHAFLFWVIMLPEDMGCRKFSIRIYWVSWFNHSQQPRPTQLLVHCFTNGIRDKNWKGKSQKMHGLR